MADELIIEAKLEDTASKGLDTLAAKVKGVSMATNDLNNNLSTRTNSAFSTFKNKVSDLGVATEGLRKRIEDLSSSLGRGLVSGMKLATVGMIGLGAAAGAMAYETEKNYTQFHNVILNFTGDNQKLTTTLYNQAKQYNDIVNISGQEAGLKQLLVNPNFRSQAGNVNSELLKISAASGNQANTVYSQLTNAVGRIEDRQRMDPRTLLMLQKAGVNILPFFKQFGFGNLAPNSPLTMAEAQKFVQEIGTPQQMLNFIQTVSKNPGISGAITRQRETPSGAVAYLKAQMENAIDDASGSFDKAISGAIGPVTKMLAGKGGLIQTLAPPLLDFIGKLAQGLSALIPVVQPILKGLAQGFSKALSAIIPAIQKMQPIGRALGQAFYKFLSAFIPVMPALVNCLVTFMQVLPAMTPPLVTMATTLSKLLVIILDFVNGMGKWLNQIGAFGVIGKGIGVLIAGLLGLKVVFMGWDAIKGIQAVFGAEGWFTKAMKGIWNFARGKPGSSEEPGTCGNGTGNCGCGGGSGSGSGGGGNCMNLCDDTATVSSLSKGIDAGLTTSAAGQTMVMSKVLTALGLIAGATGVSAVALDKILKTATASATTVTKAGAPHVLAHAHVTPTHHVTPGHTDPIVQNAIKQNTKALNRPGFGSGINLGSDLLKGAAIGGAGLGGWGLWNLLKGPKGPTDSGGKPGTPIGELSSGEQAKARVDYINSIPHAGAVIDTTATKHESAVTKVLNELGHLFSPAKALHVEAKGNPLQQFLQDAGLAGGVGGSILEVLLGGTALAQGVPAKGKTQVYNPKMGDTYSAGSSQPTTVHIHIQNANIHDVQDVKSLKEGLKKIAQDNMVRGAPHPTSWRSPGWGHTAVNALGNGDQ